MKFRGKVTNYSEKNGNSKKDNTPYVVRSWRIEEIEGQYPNSLMVESFNKEFGRITIGDVVDVEFNSRCDIYEGKMYNKISAWKIDVISSNNSVADNILSEPQGNPILENSGTNMGAMEFDLPGSETDTPF